MRERIALFPRKEVDKPAVGFEEFDEMVEGPAGQHEQIGGPVYTLTFEDFVTRSPWVKKSDPEDKEE